jgi:hypothetical protein
MSERTRAKTVARPRLEQVVRAIARRSFATLGTSSTRGRPHVAGVLYAAVDTTLFVHSSRTTRKVRNIAENPRVFVCIPVRRLPVGPPSSVQFEAMADIVAMDDPAIVALVKAGRLKNITGHGELDLPEGCFLRISPAPRINTYGLGMSLWQLLRDPLNAGGSVELT